jgi:hypothetical protein
MEEEDKRSFKVEDRRRFSAEGELKPEHRGAEEPARAEGAATGASPDQGRSQPAASTATTSAIGAGSHRTAEAGGEITFASFMVGLSTQALVMLGEIPDPHGEPGGPNLPAAQQLIDIVGMLQEKTRGNLDKDEQALIDGILFELRMKYVERARTSSG